MSRHRVISSLVFLGCLSKSGTGFDPQNFGQGVAHESYTGRELTAHINRMHEVAVTSLARPLALGWLALFDRRIHANSRLPPVPPLWRVLAQPPAVPSYGRSS